MSGREASEEQIVWGCQGYGGDAVGRKLGTGGRDLALFFVCVLWERNDAILT